MASLDIIWCENKGTIAIRDYKNAIYFGKLVKANVIDENIDFKALILGITYLSNTNPKDSKITFYLEKLEQYLKTNGPSGASVDFILKIYKYLKEDRFYPIYSILENYIKNI